MRTKKEIEQAITDKLQEITELNKSINRLVDDWSRENPDHIQGKLSPLYEHRYKLSQEVALLRWVLGETF